VIEKDDEDMWFECFNTAADYVPKNYTNRFQRTLVLAEKLYDACKAKTGKAVAEARKRAPVLQLKS
jgi:hypothetical protein